jgi:hypothetical protein
MISDLKMGKIAVDRADSSKNSTTSLREQHTM